MNQEQYNISDEHGLQQDKLRPFKAEIYSLRRSTHQNIREEKDEITSTVIGPSAAWELITFETL